jgi:hypothetical protein
MKQTGCQMSSTEGYIGNGVYDLSNQYQKHLTEKYDYFFKDFFRNYDFFQTGFPNIWKLDMMKIVNCMICSSVIIHKEILNKINNFKEMAPPGEDYDCWLRALEHTNSVFVKQPCVYYDNSHGYGRNY